MQSIIRPQATFKWKNQPLEQDIIQLGQFTIVPGSQIEGLIFFNKMLHGISNNAYEKKNTVRHQLYCVGVR